MKGAAALALLALACGGKSDKVDKLERQVAELEEELARERKDRQRAERRLDAKAEDKPDDKAERRTPLDRKIDDLSDKIADLQDSLDATRAEANKAYDQQDYARAKTLAQGVLAKKPGDIRMLRLIVSAACLSGDGAMALTYYEQIPEGRDREAMKLRCLRAGYDL